MSTTIQTKLSTSALRDLEIDLEFFDTQEELELELEVEIESQIKNYARNSHEIDCFDDTHLEILDSSYQKIYYNTLKEELAADFVHLEYYFNRNFTSTQFAKEVKDSISTYNCLSTKDLEEIYIDYCDAQKDRTY